MFWRGFEQVYLYGRRIRQRKGHGLRDIRARKGGDFNDIKQCFFVNTDT